MLRQLTGSAGGPVLRLVAAMLHFRDPKSELELLEFKRNTDLTEDEVDALWTWVRATSNSLASYVLCSVARGPLGGAGE
jgi:hypothetical protein